MKKTVILFDLDSTEVCLFFLASSVLNDKDKRLFYWKKDLASYLAFYTVDSLISGLKCLDPGNDNSKSIPRVWIYYSHSRGLDIWDWIFPFCDFIDKFSFITWEWAISHLERIRDGIFLPWVAKPRRQEKKFPHEWLSRNSERVFLHERRSREWRNSVSLWLLSHEWGNFPIPNSLQMRNNIPMLKGKLEPSLSIKLRVHIDCI